MNKEEYRKKTDILYARLADIEEYKKRCLAEQDKIIYTFPSKMVTKALKKLRDCSKFHDEKIQIRNELKRLYKERYYFDE